MSNKSIKIVKPSLENRNSACPFDFCQLVSSEYISVTYNDKTEKILTKQCPLCKRMYIHVNYFKDLKKIGIGKKEYYNLNLEDGYIRDEFIIVSKPGDKQTVYKRQIIKISENKKSNKKTESKNSNVASDNVKSNHNLKTANSPGATIHVIRPYVYSEDNKTIVGTTIERRIKCHIPESVKLSFKI